MFKQTVAVAFAMATAFGFSQSASAEAVTAGTATVIIYRADESAKTERLSLNVHGNDSRVARLSGNEVVVTETPLGEFTIDTSMPGTEPLTLDLKAGGTYYIHTRMEMRGTRVYVTLQPVEEQVARLQQPALGSSI